MFETTQKINDTRAQCGRRSDRDRIVRLPTFLAGTALPHRRPSTNTINRTDGAFTTSIRAAKHPGLPYGPYARLMAIQLTTQAIRENSLYITIRPVDSLLTQIGISASAGERGPLALALDQLRRLAATAFTFTPDNGKNFDNLLIARRWRTTEDESLDLTLTERFFDLAKKHCVPLDLAIVGQLRESTLALDMYAWLTSRVAHTENPDGTDIPWTDLANQFDPESAQLQDFRRDAEHALNAVQAAWPGLQVKVTDRALVLMPCEPSVRPTDDVTTDSPAAMV